MAHRIREIVRREGGRETQLDLLGTIVLFVAWVAAVIQLVASFAAASQLNDGAGAVVAGLLSAGLTVLGGYVLRAALGFGAEMLRLTKRADGLEFAGSISAPSPVVRWSCGSCSVYVSPRDASCPGCKQTFDEPNREVDRTAGDEPPPPSAGA